LGLLGSGAFTGWQQRKVVHVEEALQLRAAYGDFRRFIAAALIKSPETASVNRAREAADVLLQVLDRWQQYTEAGQAKEELQELRKIIGTSVTSDKETNVKSTLKRLDRYVDHLDREGRKALRKDLRLQAGDSGQSP
jgi:hypothetical protein